MNNMDNNVFICGIDIGNEWDFPSRTKHYLENSDCIVVEHIAEFNKRIRPQLNLQKNIELLELNFSTSRTKPIVDRVIELSKQNKIVSVIANSGMPTIYDPGTEIIHGLQEEKLKYTVVPGPSAITNALVASGFNLNSFMFEGDCNGGKERLEKFNKIKENLKENKTVVFFEVVHEAIYHTIQDMHDAFGSKSMVSICINLTKPDETIFTGNLKEATDWAKKYSEDRETNNLNINITYVCYIVL